MTANHQLYLQLKKTLTQKAEMSANALIRDRDFSTRNVMLSDTYN